MDIKKSWKAVKRSNWPCCMLDHVVCNWSWLCDSVFGSLVGLVDGSCDFPRWLLLSLAGSCVQCWRIRVACCWTMQPILGLSFLLASLHLFTLSLILYTSLYSTVCIVAGKLRHNHEEPHLSGLSRGLTLRSIRFSLTQLLDAPRLRGSLLQGKKQSTDPSLLRVSSAPNRFKHPGDERINCRIKRCKYLRKRHPNYDNYVLHRYCSDHLASGQRKDQAWQKRAITCGRRAGHAQSQLARRFFGKDSGGFVAFAQHRPSNVNRSTFTRVLSQTLLFIVDKGGFGGFTTHDSRIVHFLPLSNLVLRIPKHSYCWSAQKLSWPLSFSLFLSARRFQERIQKKSNRLWNASEPFLVSKAFERGKGVSLYQSTAHVLGIHSIGEPAMVRSLHLAPSACDTAGQTCCSHPRSLHGLHGTHTYPYCQPPDKTISRTLSICEEALRMSKTVGSIPVALSWSPNFRSHARSS